MPRLAARADRLGGPLAVVRTTGIPESTLAERMGEIEREVAPLTLAYLPGLDGVDLRFSAWDLAPDDGRRSAFALRRTCFGSAAASTCTARGTLIWRRWCSMRRGRAGVRIGGGRVLHRWTAGRPADRGAGQLRGVRGRRDRLRRRGQIRAAGRPGRADRAQRRGQRAGRSGDGAGRGRRFGAGRAVSVTGIAGPGGEARQAGRDGLVRACWRRSGGVPAVLSRVADRRFARERRRLHCISSSGDSGGWGGVTRPSSALPDARPARTDVILRRPFGMMSVQVSDNDWFSRDEPNRRERRGGPVPADGASADAPGDAEPAP